MNFLNNMAVKTKLMLLTIITLASLLAVSLSGNYGINACGDALIEVSETRLPSVLGLEIINEGQTAIKANSLETPIYELNYNANKQFAEIVKKDAEIWSRIENGWNIYAPLPQTPEEAELWKQFEKEWAAWKQDAQGLTKLTQKLADNTNPEVQKALFAQYYAAYEAQRKTFAAAESTLGKIIDLNIEVAKVANDEGKVTISFSKSLMLSIAVIAIAISILFSTLITRSVTASLNSIQSGLNAFFRFLNRESTKAELIDLKSEDEFGQMAKVINENITSIEKGLVADANAVANAVQVANRVKAGHLNEQINVVPNNPQLAELRSVLNEMLTGLNGNVEKVLSVLKVYANNDFNPRADKASLQGEVASLIDGVNNLGNEISTMLGASLRNGMELQGDAGSLKQAVEALSTASNEQAASLEETAAAMEEMTSNVQQNAQKANDMASMAAQTDASAKEGAELAHRTATAMTEIQEATNSINSAVAIIENIAFQTNILSLNAAVEAATAGEAGKGFAVVAQEVRNLANRSADAAKEIKALAEQAASKSSEGMSIATELTRGFEVIAGKIEQTTMLVQDVSNASREQMQGISQINTAVTQLDQMTQENAKIAAEADNIANSTIDKAQAMVTDASSKNFVGKSDIQASGMHHNTARPAHKPAARSAHKAAPAAKPATFVPTAKSEDDIWESF
ncbi:MAG: hypothetical protein CJD30_01170 [Sulfuricurvum sp. PD_MW2]|uniref:HAMP domain-containing methyl-accepting chemotaxis protein n=1 Tax=Sulfuricurvum sp. PD_MW2 TaxID=2027917 RepID=UPI000C05CE6B|nr:methyl-accepting chemotaxis protein [Sulfuricurvum sp. PD_MW2]PHM18558.1 MAG: hypothetical protein CJD30_01170 [Sulfuricurvum sp. PD_MW2]